MYELTIIDFFASAHSLRGYDGECEALHGHNWKVEATVRADRLDSVGLAIDFKELKKVIDEIIGKLDHVYLNELPEFKNDNPSSEIIAKHIFEELEKRITREGLWVYKVTAWESDKACASYMRS